MVKLNAALVNKRWEGLFHSDGRTSSTYITSGGQQFFHGNEVNFLVATEFGGFFQVYLMVTGDDTHEMLGLLAEEYQRLENLIDVFSNGSSQMPSPMVAARCPAERSFSSTS